MQQVKRKMTKKQIDMLKLSEQLGEASIQFILALVFCLNNRERVIENDFETLGIPKTLISMFLSTGSLGYGLYKIQWSQLKIKLCS